MAVQSRSYNSFSFAQQNANDEENGESTLVISQRDFVCGRIQNIARRQNDLKSIIFKDCSDISFDQISDLCRSNRNVRHVSFQNCKSFKKDAFEAFRSFDKALEYLDLSGYYINIEELKSLLRAGFENLKMVIFRNRTDIHSLFVQYYPTCKIEITHDSHGEKSRLKPSKSDYDIKLEKKLRETEKLNSKDRSRTSDELAHGISKLSMKHGHSDHSSCVRSHRSSSNSVESLKRKAREDRRFRYDSHTSFDDSTESDDSDKSEDSDVFEDERNYVFTPKKNVSASSSRNSLSKLSPSKKSPTKQSKH